MIIINDNKYLEVRDVMSLLKMSQSNVLKLVSTKKIKAFKPSERKTYFSERALQDYLEGK